MQLRDYLGVLGQWPPPGRASAKPGAAPSDCEDILARTSYFRSPGTRSIGIRITTVFSGEYFERDLMVDDKIFATVFCEFLEKHQGRSIRMIGRMDVDFS
jgi:hypothetical protein